ncbi:DUF3800 domain-containing protein [Uliginosibacterium sp. 31-16]|uniref:DUF3800 domain-containing protein n=1 Tax=Uliginosibacterium sp. 31-16 TaxID=3068315 RepID=UPI00273F8A14|nr:DUF3800 domain-containing protein [Uliginosibacterium sp. 31-16]MDP5239757.1 DUF3800 domain-containing protein [Uliginosibacterium sp. 31-16]
MKLLYCDETNFGKNANDFFVYGGIVIDASNAASLSHAVEKIRKELGVPRDYTFKFNPGPKNFSHEQFIELKSSIIKVVAEHDCKLLINLLLHDIATSSEDARRFGVNTLCYHFDCFLNRPKVAGLVLIDRFDDKQIDGQLKEKLAIGLTGKLPYGGELKIEHIVGYHLTAIGQSHFCSIVDVMLGSLRFAINAFTQKNEQHMQTAKNILAQLAPLFWREGSEKVHEISLWFSPKEVKSLAYREKYLALKGFLAENGIDAAQGI